MNGFVTWNSKTCPDYRRLNTILNLITHPSYSDSACWIISLSLTASSHSCRCEKCWSLNDQCLQVAARCSVLSRSSLLALCEYFNHFWTWTWTLPPFIGLNTSKQYELCQRPPFHLGYTAWTSLVTTRAYIGISFASLSAVWLEIWLRLPLAPALE